MSSSIISNFTKSFASMRQQCAMSLKAKLILMTVGLFVLFIWVLVFVSGAVLQNQFEQVLFDQQYASVQRLASELDNKLQERVQSLVKVAENVPADLRAPALAAYLAQFGGLHITFSAGITIIGLDGKAIADFPAVPGRRGTYFGDRNYFRHAVATQQPYIDKPIIGRALKRPVLTIAVPLFDKAGKLRAVMTGITDLTAPNFLGPISDRTMAGKAEFFIIAPQDKLIVAATDTARMMTASPERGRNLMYDRFVEGFEGSGIAANARGVSSLYSGKYVPTAHWIVMAALPTEVAFGSVKLMQNYLNAAAAIMTLLAILLIQWLTRRMLAPLDMAGRAMRDMTDGRRAMAPLPVKRNDEIGKLIRNFNLLVEDRYRYETALAESEQRLSMLVESAPDAIFVQTRACFAYVNAATLHLFGATSKEQLVGHPVLNRMHPDNRELVRERIRQLNQERKTVPSSEYKCLRLDGTEVEVAVSAVPFRYDNEDGALVFLRDITKKKSAERLLLKREEEFRALVENSPDVVCRFDRSTCCVYANPAMEKATGLRCDQIIGRTCEQIGLPHDGAAKWMDSTKKVFVTRLTDTFEFSLRAPTGDRYYQARFAPEFGSDGKVLNVVAVARDISVIKGGEAVLRESEQRIHAITANTPGMVFQCILRARDGALLFTYVSEGSLLLLGLTPGEIQANRHAIPGMIAERDRDAFDDSLRYSAHAMEVWNWEGRTRPVDGTEKWINCRATPRPSSDGDIIWEGVMFNITASKRSEEDIQQSRQLLRELSAHLENVREEERKRIAREVHDELGQALTVLRMDVSLLRLNFGGHSPQLMDRIQSMKEVVDRTIGTVRHITSSLRPAALDLGLTAAIEWLAEEFIGRTGIDCVLNTEGSEVVLDDGRATALFRIVQESLMNVVKHASASEVEISIRAEDDQVWLAVRDNGKGFPAERTRKAGSFGLIGMRERALMLNGKVEIHSVVGEGTCVSVCIPLSAG